MAHASTSARGRVLLLGPNTPLKLNGAEAKSSSSPSTTAAGTLSSHWTTSSCKPRLPGQGMPTLDWPDSSTGPWSSASRPSRLENEKRKLAIARWLEEESDDEPCTDQSTLHHPMIAKVFMDRKRNDLLSSSSQSVSTPSSMTSLSSKDYSTSASLSSHSKSKRHRKNGDDDLVLNKGLESPSIRRQKLRKKQSGKKAIAAQQSPITPRKKKSKKPAANEGKHARESGGLMTAQNGCQCGQNDDSGAAMVQCDGCDAWYHLTCAGVGDDNNVLHEGKWYCVMCYDIPSDNLTPSSNMSNGLSMTPFFPRLAVGTGQQARLAQGQLPFFTHTIETPHNHREQGHAHAISSALALAPSPVVPSSTSSTVRRPQPGHVGGRARASRVGWHNAEPGSPLERKSHSAFNTHKRNLSGSGGIVFYSPSPRHSRYPLNGGESGMEEQHGGAFNGSSASSNAAAVAAADVYLRTPSPRLPASATPTRARQSSSNFGVYRSGAAYTNGSVSGHRRESSGPMRDFDDVFSTPSRILSGSSAWGQASMSMMRHSRQESSSGTLANESIGGSAAANITPWGLSTPTRHMMDAGFQSDYSGGAAGGLPSLVHSSGGLDNGDFAGWHHLQMSPTSSTRGATRARQQSAAATAAAASASRHTSSMRQPATPDRSSVYDASSSSPFPKTPTFSTDTYRHHYDFENAYGDEYDNDLPMSMRGSGLSNSAAAVGHHRQLSANRRLSSLSNSGVNLSPKVHSPSTSHTRTMNVPAKSRNNSYMSSTGGNGVELHSGLQGPVELKSRNGKMATTGAATALTSSKQHHALQQHGSKPRTRNASNDLMAGLGIGLDLSEEIEWP